MNKNQYGFGGLQIILGLAVVAALAAVAVPQYNSYIAKAKLSEAFSLAGDTKKKLSEFYIEYNRFPRTAGEAAAMKTTTVAPPEFVREIIVNHQDSANDIVIEVYMYDGEIENPTGEVQYIYWAGNSSSRSGSLVEWTCGAYGMDPELLPKNC